MKLFALSAIIFLSCVYTSAQNSLRDEVNTAVEKRDWSAAQKLLQSSSGTEEFRLNNFDYFLGRIAEKNEDFAVAAEAFQRVADSDSILREYALWHLAKLAKISGNGLLERIYLDELSAFHNDSLLTTAANNRIARSLFESGNYIDSINAFRDLKTNDATEQASRENMAFIARAYLNAGMLENARTSATALLDDLPDPTQPDDHASEAAQILDQIDRTQNRQTTELEHMNRASIYQFNRDFTAAREHYLAILNDFPAGFSAPEATLQIGIGYARVQDFGEALKWFERLLEQYPEHELREEALIQSAAAYSRVGKFKESIRRYESYIELYPNRKRLDRAYLNAVDALRDSHENTIAIRWTKLTQDKFGNKLPAAQALFAEARIYIARDQWPEAIDALESLSKMPELGGASVPGGTSKPEIEFLRAYCLEQARRYDEAIDGYLSITDGREEYFGNIATDRLRKISQDSLTSDYITKRLEILRGHPRSKENLQAMIRLTVDEQSRKDLIAELAKIYRTINGYNIEHNFKMLPIGRSELTAKLTDTSNDKHKAIADELVFLNIYDEAAPEFEASPRIKTTDPDNLAYTVAELYRRGGKADRGVSFMESRWKAPADFEVELIPKDVTSFLYPAPFQGELIQSTAQRDFDPRLMLSIMRQESRFRPNAKSYAAARGLMQFVSTTADVIAGELGKSEFSQRELYDSKVAILFGSQYLFDLYKIFPNQTEAVTASYNGGEENVKRWLARSHSHLADIYVSEIAYGQTKDYVFRVMTNYRVYRELYNADLSLQP